MWNMLKNVVCVKIFTRCFSCIIASELVNKLEEVKLINKHFSELLLQKFDYDSFGFQNIILLRFRDILLFRNGLLKINDLGHYSHLRNKVSIFFSFDEGLDILLDSLTEFIVFNRE